MALGQRLEIRQGQSLVMTPQLQQAIKLLQLSNIELAEYCEAELEKSAQTWAAVPRLAYRLSVLASLSLLVAGGWLYQQPRHVTVGGVSMAQNNEGLVEGGSGATQDDFFLNPADREK